MTVTIITGDCREMLKTLPDNSVHCCVTSPPYWGLRDYGTAQWEGGDARCDHVDSHGAVNAPCTKSTLTTNGGRGSKEGDKYHASQTAQFCGKCGAIRKDQQLGLESTPEEYVANMVAVFREVRRVLRDDGTCWLNLGDSYSSHSGGAPGDTIASDGYIRRNRNERGRAIAPNLKPKDLVGIPWRVAFALQADGAASPAHMETIHRMIAAIENSYDGIEFWPDRIRQEVERLEREWIDAHRGGWWLRSDIIWHKPNPMPESVTDRPTKAHEYVFLLSKSARYFYDADAVREENSPTSGKWGKSVIPATAQAQGNGRHGRSGFMGGEMTRTEVVERYYTNGRNRRSVWTVATRPYSGAHFATFPPDLIEPCIKAGTSERGVCPVCGAQWERVVERTGVVHKREPAHVPNNSTTKVDSTGWEPATRATNKFIPACDHDAEPVPATVLDHFGGAVTTGLVADRLGRDAIVLELNSEYADMGRQRIVDDAGMFADVRVIRGNSGGDDK